MWPFNKDALMSCGAQSERRILRFVLGQIQMSLLDLRAPNPASVL